MSFRIEIAFNVKHTGSLNLLKDSVIALANKCNAISNYINYEYWGVNRTITRNHMVLVIYFPDDINNITQFLSNIKNNREIYVESIGLDDIKFKLIYASKKYLNMMDKGKAKEYKKIKESNFYNLIDYVK